MCQKARQLTKKMLLIFLDVVSNVYNYIIKYKIWPAKKQIMYFSMGVSGSCQTLNDKTGICFDYASLTCAMLRSQGIPTKLGA